MAQIKQLCCLGLGAEATAPALIRLLLRLIPGFSASVFFSDESGELVKIYDENPALTEVGPLYVSEFHNRRETETWIGFTESFRRGLVGMTVDQLIKVDRRTWERSDMYNLIFRPLGYDGGLRLAVRDRGRRSAGSRSRAAPASRTSRRATSTSWSRSSPISRMHSGKARNMRRSSRAMPRRTRG